MGTTTDTGTAGGPAFERGDAAGIGEVSVAAGAAIRDAASGGRSADNGGGVGVGVRLSPTPNSQARLAKSTSTKQNANFAMLFIFAFPSPG